MSVVNRATSVEAVRPAGPAAGFEFADFVADVAHALEHTVPGWRVRLGDAAMRWRAEGIRTSVLERALALPHDPGADALIGTFAGAVARLRALERVAVLADPALAGAACFRDPELLREAAATAAGARAAARPAGRARPTPARPSLVRVDAERWVRAWPTVDVLLPDESA
jgi:hypothetical protein